MLLKEMLKPYRLILASKSPRRQQLLREMDVPFEVLEKNIKEKYPKGLLKDEIAGYLAALKAGAFLSNELYPNDIVITADTIVCMDSILLEKPLDPDEALNMIVRLSGKTHEVITGVCIRDQNRSITFTANTHVTFKSMSEEEIWYYISKYKPFDKAGAYGIQEWIGYIGISHIEGSYFNVVGLPTCRLYEELIRFIKEKEERAIAGS